LNTYKRWVRVYTRYLYIIQLYIEKLKTNSLDHTFSSNTANNIPGFDFVKEIQEREIKSRNILLFNVVESQDDEMKLATDLIKSLHIDVPIT